MFIRLYPKHDKSHIDKKTYYIIFALVIGHEAHPTLERCLVPTSDLIIMYTGCLPLQDV